MYANSRELPQSKLAFLPAVLGVNPVARGSASFTSWATLKCWPATLMRFALAAISCIGFFQIVALRAMAADDAPDWLRQAASASVPAYDKSVPAVVLYDETTTTVDPDGRVVRTLRRALKVLNREGRDVALAKAVYDTDMEKIRDIQAWLIRPGGTVRHYKKDSVVDMILLNDDVYNQARQKLILAGDDATEGAVFGFESTIENRSVYTQFDCYFQIRYPVIVSRFVLNLPPGWHADGITFNHAPVGPQVSGTSYTWELRDLPYLEREPEAPSIPGLAPRLAVSYYPPDKNTAALSRSFYEWTDVSRWLSELSDPQSQPNDAISAKSRSLVAGAASEFDRIKDIAAYIQTVHYIAIQTGIGRGGGYRPHTAADVFSKSYGDCKDKANLMRAMLKAIGIDSYLVSIYSGDPLYVRKEWASPQQFNHCIIAIKLKDETVVPTTVEHPTLGRLLIFDPTDVDTPVGDLPEDEQGSLALIIAGDAGRLMKMPVIPAEANLVHRKVEATLSGDGSLAATVSQQGAGQSAASLRGMSHHLGQQDFTKLIEEWIAAGVGGAIVEKIEPADDRAANRYLLNIKFSSRSYGQLMQGRLLVFKPAMISRRGSKSFAASTRKQPVILSSDALDEEVKIKLPAGFDVDEMPDAVKLETEFGRYSASCQVKDGYLVFKRSILIGAAVIPPQQYSAVRGFIGRVQAADAAPVVLVKK